MRTKRKDAERGRELDPGDAPTAGSPPGEALDARVRLKLDRGLPLTAEERAFFANLPGSKELPPDAVQRGDAAPR